MLIYLSCIVDVGYTYGVQSSIRGALGAFGFGLCVYIVLSIYSIVAWRVDVAVACVLIR